MFRILMVSDVHAERFPSNVQMFDRLDDMDVGKIDLAIVGGDTNRAPVLVETLDRLIPKSIGQIAFVTGNHDYRETGLTIDEADEVIFRDVEAFNKRGDRKMTFLSAKDGSRLTVSCNRDSRVVYRIFGDCQWGNETKVDDDSERSEYRRIKGFTTDEGLLRYQLAEDQIAYELEQTLKEGRKVAHIVVTHHLPDVTFQPERYRPELPTGPFSGSMMNLVYRHEPLLWVFGHTHGGIDRKVGKTLFLNPAVGAAVAERVKHPYIVNLQYGKVVAVESLVWL